MQAPVAILLVALSLAFGNAVCAHQSENDAKIISLATKERQGAWLGVAIQDVTKRLAEKEGLKAQEGAYVSEVVEESPADSAGVQEGDVIVEFGGKSVAGSGELMEMVKKRKPGTEVTVGIMRGGQKKSVNVVLGSPPRRREFRVVVPRVPSVPPIHFRQGSSLYGMSVMKLGNQLGEYFEAPGGKGVLVERVKKGSGAEKAGFKAGDVIVRAGKTTVTDPDDLWETMGDYKEGEKVDLEIIRKGARKTLTLEADDAERGSRMHFRFDHKPHLFKDDDLEELEELESWAPDSEQIRSEIEKANRKIEEAQRQFDNQEFRREMDQLKKELKRIPEEIQQNMRDLKEQLKKVQAQREV